MSPKFIFVRHAEATHNTAFRDGNPNAFTGEEFEDAPLTEAGQEQAKKLAEELSKYKIIDIWSSSLSRALETAEEIFEETSAEKLYAHDSLVEVQYAKQICNRRKTKMELEKKFMAVKTDYLPDMPSVWFTNENKYAVHQRLFMFMKLMEDLYKDHTDDEHVVIVGHGNAFGFLLGKNLKNAEHVVLSLQEVFKV
jgi:broad specificity phosphatase PhoE